MTTDAEAEARLPRSDFIVIPLIALLTLVVLFGLGEFTSRTLYVESGVETCGTVGPDGAAVMRPDCTSHRKAAEGPDTVNAYNDCGYRTPEPCHARLAGGIRVALMGASTAQGFKVPYPDTFAARLSQALTLACHKPVEFQTMGVPGADLVDIYRRTDEALAMHPDLVLMVITPYEMKALIDPERLAHRDLPIAAPSVRGAHKAAALPPRSEKSLAVRLSDIALNSRMLFVAQHLLFQDHAAYVKFYLLNGEDADYLRLPYRAGWERRLRDADTLLGDMAARTQAAGVPLMLALAPQRIQAALLDPALSPPNVDPFEIGRRLAAVAARHGILFQDSLRNFETVNDPERMFYAVDGHMDAEGNAVFAQSVLNRLTHDAPVFRDCPRAAPAGN